MKRLASIASSSAGPGSRANIDELTGLAPARLPAAALVTLAMAPGHRRKCHYQLGKTLTIP